MNGQPMNATATDPAATPRRPSRWGWGAALLLVVVAWGAAFALRHGGEKVELVGWVDGLEAGQAQAAEMGRPMLVLFTADWCGYCQVLKREVFSRPEIDRALRERFVPVIVDATDSSAVESVLLRYDVKSLPTVIAMTSEGEAIDRFSGSKPIDWVGPWLESVAR